MSDSDKGRPYVAILPGAPGYCGMCSEDMDAANLAETLSEWIRAGCSIDRVEFAAALAGMREFDAALVKMANPEQAELEIGDPNAD